MVEPNEIRKFLCDADHRFNHFTFFERIEKNVDFFKGRLAELQNIKRFSAWNLIMTDIQMLQGQRRKST